MSLLDTASLIVTPSGYKEGKLYSVIPSDGSGDMSVTRATTATRVNSAGLVELVPYNLVNYSEQFDNLSYWGLSQVSVSANSTTAPNGTTTADTITDSSTFGYTYQSVPLSGGVGSIVTNSVFLKRTNNDWVNVAASRIPGTTYGEFGVWFNLATGVIGSNFQAGAGIVVDSEITDEGDGWYRCSVTGYVPNAVGYVPYVFNSNADNSFTSSAGKSRYQWGAQLNEGSTALPYQKTETRLNIPRLDYSNGTCPSLLVEPQRTNLFTYSSSFDNGAWLLLNATISVNTITSPSGIQDADSIIENTATGIHIFYQGPIAASSGIYTASMFFKKNTRQYAFLQIAVNGAADRFTAVIDLNNGNITDTTTVGSPTSTSYTTEDFGNGWYRLTVSAQHNSGNVFLVSGLSDSATPTYNVTGEPNYTGNGTSGVYIWGAQLEAGSYATSYIPTTSASVTRNADVISKTGISSLIGQTEGTIFGEVQVIPQKTDSMLCLIATLSAGTYANFFYIRATNGIPAVSVRKNDTTYVSIDGTTALSEGFHKFAFAYKQNDFAFYVDGVLIGTDTSGEVPLCDEVYLGNYVDGFDREVSKKSFALWKTRLTNTQLAQLTTI